MVESHLTKQGSMARKRTRLGCLNCRRRRRKCDGLRPDCKSCLSRGYTCVYGLKASFHHSRNLSLSHDEAAELMKIEGEQSCYSPRPYRIPLIVDETREIINEYLGGGKCASSKDVCRLASPEVCSHGHGHHVQSSATLDSYTAPFFLGQAVSPGISLPEPSLPVSGEEKAHLIALYLQETGTWCNTTDSQMQFTVGDIHRMMKTPAFAAAAMALASRQKDNIERCQHPMTLELYQYTIQLLIHQNPEEADASILASCTLLCVYEMMASPVSEWRRHLKGCAGLLQTRMWNGSCTGIVNSCFWAFARIDVWAAFISGKTTLIPTDSWLDDMSIKSVGAKGNVDDYCNLAILIFAKVVNLRASMAQDNSIKLSCHALWDDLETWYRFRPVEVVPLVREAPTSRNVFPCVVFSRSSSICGNTFYHAASILLLQTGVLSQREGEVVWHARELAGITISNASHANWVNQVQPLYIAGTVFGAATPYDSYESHTHSVRSDSDTQIPAMTMRSREKYATEKILLLKHLALIERETGWKTSDRAADLRRLWGFD